MQQSIYQGSAVLCGLGCAGTSVYHHSGRLVDYRQVVVFVNNVKRNFFSKGAKRRSLHFANDFNLFTAAQVKRRLCDFSVDQHFSLRDELLHSRSAGVRKMRNHELIETLACMRVGDKEFRFGVFQELVEQGLPEPVSQIST